MVVPELFRRYTTRAVAVFDIGSGSVGAAVLHMGHGNTPTVVVSKRIVLSFEKRDKKHTIAAIERAMQDAADQIQDAYRKSSAAREAGPIEQVCAIVHAPWIASHTTEQDAHLKKPAVITKKMVHEVGQRAMAAKADGQEDEIFERSIIYTALNGYRTSEPIGKQAQELSIKVLQSTLEPEVHAFVTRIAQNAFPGRTLTIRSATLMFTQVLNAVAGGATHYTFLDITSEATQCLDIRHGTIAQCTTVPLGMRTIIHELVTRSKTTAEDMQSSIRMAAQETCSTAACKKTLELLAAVEPMLTKNFGEMFTAVASEKRLPNRLIIAAHPDISGWLGGFFARLDFSQFTATGRPFVVHRLLKEHLEAHVAPGEGVALDPAIATAAVFVHKYLPAQ